MRCLFGRFKTFAAGTAGKLCDCPCRDFDDAGRLDELDGGRGAGGRGDADRGRGGGAVVVGVGRKTPDIGGRAFSREDDVGRVNRSAVGLVEGVEGRVGGTP